MNAILNNYHITEFEDGKNLSFFIDQEGTFSITDYKVLRGQIRSGLARCEKVLYNGKIKLLYLTEGGTPLEMLLSRMDERMFTVILADIMSVVINISENGFLEMQKLLLDSRYIFVDENTMKVKMIYIPVDSREFHSSIQNGQILTLILGFIRTCTNLSGMYVTWITELFSKEKGNLRDIYDEILNRCNVSGKLTEKEEEKQSEKTEEKKTTEKKEPKILYMYSLNEPVLIQFIINQRDFYIGRDPKRVDGTINGHPTVGRKHCHVVYKEGEYYLEDDASKNGTFLNDEKLTSGLMKKIPDQARIQIADVLFTIRYD